MFSYLSSFFSSPSQPASPSALPSTTTTPSPEDTSSPSQPSSSTATSSSNHLERNRKKRLAKKKSKQRRRQSTLNNGGGGGGGGSDDSDSENADEDFPDADDDLSYIPLEPDNTPSLSTTTTGGRTKKRSPQSTPEGAQPSQIPPTEVFEAVSRLPPLLPNGEKLPNDERAKRIIRSQGFVPVEDQDGGLHVGVQVREGIVAVLGGDGKPLLFNM
ncbi:hypothetical protein JCM5350_000503 [Sporobolomyces pararoseus]